MKPPVTYLTALFCVCLVVPLFLRAQTDCSFKPPVVHIHFGRGAVRDINATPLPGYAVVAGPCPTDGYYSFASATSDCFLGDWFTLVEDHTPGDVNGNMMLVNASPYGGEFFRHTLRGLKGGTTYELSAWMMNVCRIRGGCPPLPPNILVRLTTPSGKVVAEFLTGLLEQRPDPQWTQYRRLFTTPTGETALLLTMNNTTTGSCGNDFALDDITLRECTTRETPLFSLASRAARAIRKHIVPPPTPAKEKRPAPEPAKPAVTVVPVAKVERQPAVEPPPLQAPTVTAPLPPVLRLRRSELAKEIETAAGEIRIALYDNGTVDGDTVSVYHNGVLVVSAAALSQKPVTYRLTVDARQPRHELVMVAHNLGSIPPNTSLMIVTAGEVRHEAFISSSEQKNAKVVIRLRE